MKLSDKADSLIAKTVGHKQEQESIKAQIELEGYLAKLEAVVEAAEELDEFVLRPITFGGIKINASRITALQDALNALKV